MLTADVIVAGGGPAGSTAALQLAREGHDVLLFEGERHPRFHIGESFLPRNLELIEELGLAEGFARIPQIPKLGGSFGFAQDETLTHYDFEKGLLPRPHEAFNIQRAGFDAFLLDEARKAGARVTEGSTVRKIHKLEHGDVEIELRDDAGEASTARARWLVDASGQSTIVGRHLKTRQTLPDLRRVAYFGHFEGLPQTEGDKPGYPIILMCQEGWFWFIPLDDGRTSIGIVMREADARKTGIPGKQMLFWAIDRCPAVRRRVEGATFPERNGVTADFSYACRPYAGPGYFLVGDAAAFVDPIFSTGVCMGMMSAVEAARAITRAERDTTSTSDVTRRYVRFVEGSSSAFFDLVRLFYRHSFRELFVAGEGPLKVHRAVISLLCGHVFPRPPLSVRWRLQMFDAIIGLNQRLPIVPRKASFSLLDATTVPSSIARRVNA